MDKYKPRWFYCSMCEFSFVSRYRKGSVKPLLMAKCPICKTMKKVLTDVDVKVAKGTRIYQIQ